MHRLSLQMNLPTMKKMLVCIFCCIHLASFSQDSSLLKIHFLYGSKPKKAFKSTEKKWFGGKLGGHAGIESDDGRILNFIPGGKFHVFQKKKDPHSSYAVHSANSFYAILGGDPDSVKKAIVYIPISRQQRERFDSITTAYLAQTPYDYALFGMRCGAATYEMLAQLDILPQYSNSKIYKKIFYPKKLRKRLFKEARKNNWIIYQEEGSERRKWERD